jgi:hypothetical protein
MEKEKIRGVSAVESIQTIVSQERHELFPIVNIPDRDWRQNPELL